MVQMKIREYKDKDKKRVIKTIKEVLYEIFKQKPTKIDDLNNIKKNFDIFYVVEDNHKIIGTIGLQKHKDKIARLKRLYLKKEYRGKGIGEKLLNRIINFAKLKYNKIILSTYPEMERAILLYKKNGFKEFKRNEQIWFEKRIK